MSSNKETKSRLESSRITGVSIPLGAIATKKNTVIGEFTVLPDFAKFCKKAGLGIIQLLPVNDTGTQSSPYSGLSAFALHPIYIDLKQLPEFEALYSSDKKFAKNFDAFVKGNPYDGKSRYKYDEILNRKDEFLRALYETTSIAKEGKADAELEKWIKKNPWIVNYAVYKSLKYKYMQASWKEWDAKDQNLSEKEIKARWTKASNQKENLFYAWTQMRAAEQFKKACDAVKKAGLLLKGDMPILMNEDSCDAWAIPGVFNQNLRAGSPVDNENPAGQNWGFPTYNWAYLKENDYSWWKDRLKSAEQYYSVYRLDHILGFFRIWAIPTRDTTAILGHTDPYVAIRREQFHNAGFDDGKIRWLSQPHVRTGSIEDITWNHETATKILEKFCDRIGNEELWLFKKSIQGDKDIYESDLSALCQGDAEGRVKDVLSGYWKDRTFVEITPDNFVPIWTYSGTTAWNSLNYDEQGRLRYLIEEAEAKQNQLWETQSDEILSALTNSVNMIPCGEDLGANLPCLHPVMAKNNILSLAVYRWSRQWNIQPEQPYILFNNLPKLSVCTSSVHDSTTLRQWWDEDKGGVNQFVRTYPQYFGIEGWDNDAKVRVANESYTPEKGLAYLTALASANSDFCIHPLQDFLSVSKKYWLDDSDAERINIPGTVSEFNWTYRIPALLEDISKDEELIAKIKGIADAHLAK